MTTPALRATPPFQGGEFDVVVIGGSLAGSACVRELRRLGIDAVAFERDTFPRHKVCGGFLSPGAVDCLDELGLLNAVRAAGAVDVDHARIRAAGRQFEIPFSRKGLGISRSALDHIAARGAAVEQGTSVRNVRSCGDGFIVETDAGETRAAVVIDAAGKLSRFSRRTAVAEFGVQYFESATRGSALDFWFFKDGYGGAVTVEGARSNFSFLIKKGALRRYVSKPDHLVTGPLAYDRTPGDAIAIGDAAGMIDPFCAEGMHHALDSAMIAARVVCRGLRQKQGYADMKHGYELEWSRRWSAKRLMGRSLRHAVGWPEAVRVALALRPRWFLEWLWATIPS